MIQQEILNELKIPGQLVSILNSINQFETNDQQEFDYFGVPIREKKNILKKVSKKSQRQNQQIQNKDQDSQKGDDYVEVEIMDPNQVKPLRFDDDEPLNLEEIQQQQQFREGQAYNLNENLEFYLTSQYKTVRIEEQKQLTCLLGFKSKEITIHQQPSQIVGDAQNQFNIDQQQHSKVGVDLFCIIDRSGSMSGTKIEMVKQTLNILLNFLSPKDRLCLIQFDDQCQRLTNLRRVTDENKTYYSDIIQQIQANGGTVISLGTQMALKQIKYRKYQNNVTAIFLLSDGQDDDAASKLAKQLKYYKQTLTIHSFGFGSDHDAKLMTRISNLGQGSFYFVNEISLLDEFFVDALGALTSMVASDIQIKLVNETKAPFNQIKVSKFYGDKSFKLDGTVNYLHIPYLAEGQRRDFVFTIKIPALSQEQQSQNEEVLIFSAEITMKNSQTGEICKKQNNLILKFVGPDVQFQEEENLMVQEQFFRVESADVIKNALEKCRNQKNDQAIKMIDELIDKIQGNQGLVEQTKNLLIDLEQVKQASKKEHFNRFGSKQMYQIISNNQNQQGINAKFDASGIQQQQEEQAQYQTSKQMMWMKKVQFSKKCKP